MFLAVLIFSVSGNTQTGGKMMIFRLGQTIADTWRQRCECQCWPTGKKNPQRDSNSLLIGGVTSVQMLNSQEKKSNNKNKINWLSFHNTKLLWWYFHLLNKEVMNFRQELYFCSHLLLWRASRTFYLARADLWIINIWVVLPINWKLPGGSN